MQFIFVFAIFFWILYSHAESCPRERTAVLKEALVGLQKELDPQTTVYWDATRKAEELMVQLNDLEVNPDIVVALTANQRAQSLSEQQMVSIRAQVDAAKKSIDQGLQQPDGVGLVNSIRQAYNDGVGKIEKPEGNENDQTSFEKAKQQVIQMRAFTQMAQDSLKLIEDTIYILQEKCRENISFTANIDGEKYEFAGCSSDKYVGNLETMAWGGKIPADGCRYVVSCTDMKGPEEAFLSGFWVLDCKKKNNSCPIVSACASQIQAGDGEIQSTPVIKRKGSSR